MSKLKEILDGWGNRVKDEFGMLDIETKKLAAQRLAICDSCYVRSGNSCSTKLEGYNAELGKMVPGSGCNIAAKTMSPTSKCPRALW